jgi:hypothetical protein
MLFGAIHRAIYLIGILNLLNILQQKFLTLNMLKEMTTLSNIEEHLEEQVYPFKYLNMSEKSQFSL